MARTAVLGFPRIGAEREPMFALEATGPVDPDCGLKTRAALRNLVAAAQRRRAAMPA